jgi:hypothetical protein
MDSVRMVLMARVSRSEEDFEGLCGMSDDSFA